MRDTTEQHWQGASPRVLFPDTVGVKPFRARPDPERTPPGEPPTVPEFVSLGISLARSFFSFRLSQGHGASDEGDAGDETPEGHEGDKGDEGHKVDEGGRT